MNKNETPTVVSIINLKGGVGKTTVATLLARNAAERYGLDVLAVDLDPQANLSQALLLDDYMKFMESRALSIVELFNKVAPPSAINHGPTELKSEYLVRKAMEYYGKGNLELLPSRFDFSDNLIDSAKRVEPLVLSRFISQNMGHKDLILIDCAPTESVITKIAYHASRYIIIPVRTEFLSTIGFPLLKESLDNFQSRNHGHAIEVKGVLINANRTPKSPLGPHHRSSLKDIKSHARRFEWPVFGRQMHHSDGYPKLTSQLLPSNTGNAEIEFRGIADEILPSLGFPKP